MTPDTGTSLPNGLTEADVIDLVDGVLSREREGLVLTALKQDPRLGLLAKQFRADREAVAGLGDVRAPAGLAEGIEARLEAAALRDLSTASRQVPAAIPVSQVESREPGSIRLLLENVWTRRLAMAASLAIVAGLGVWGVYGAITRMKPGTGGAGSGLAHANPADNSGLGAPMPAPTPTIDVASNDSTGDSDVHPPVVVASADPIPAEMTEARAARLASEGRLAITLRAPIAAATLKQLDVRARAHDNGWRIVAMENVPAQYAALLMPVPEVVPVRPTPGLPNPIAIAGDQTASPAVTPISAPTPAALPHLHPVVKGMYTVELGAGDQSLAALVRSITDVLPAGVTLAYRELPQAVVAPVAVDPESVLWWSASGTWSRKATLPVVVEGLE